MIQLSYLFRLKKYGKWQKGKTEISADVPKSEYMNSIRLYLESEYPESNRIEIQNVERIFIRC